MTEDGNEYLLMDKYEVELKLNSGLEIVGGTTIGTFYYQIFIEMCPDVPGFLSSYTLAVSDDCALFRTYHDKVELTKS